MGIYRKEASREKKLTGNRETGPVCISLPIRYLKTWPVLPQVASHQEAQRWRLDHLTPVYDGWRWMTARRGPMVTRHVGVDVAGFGVS